MVFVALMAFRALGGQYSGRDSEGVAAAAVFWDAAVALASGTGGAFSFAS